MRNMVIESAQNKIGELAKGVHVIWTFDLIHQPGAVDGASMVGAGIGDSFHMMGHEESE